MPIVVVFWRWYYGQAIKDILTGWRNYIIFSLNYFSIPLLLKTLFAPWKRDITRKPRGFDFSEFFEYFSFNAVSRAIGFFVRLFAIVAGIIFFFLVVVLGLIIFVIWLFLPFIIVGLLIFAVIQLI